MKFMYFGENRETGTQRMAIILVKNESEYEKIKAVLKEDNFSDYNFDEVPEYADDYTGRYITAFTFGWRTRMTNIHEAREVYNELKKCMKYIETTTEETTTEETTETEQQTDETTAEETTAEGATAEGTTAEKIFSVKNKYTGFTFSLSTYFKCMYESFIETFNHDIDILSDWFRGDYEMIEETTAEECVKIINEYIDRWVNDDTGYIPAYDDGTELNENDFEFNDYMKKYEDMFTKYKILCRQYYNIF